MAQVADIDVANGTGLAVRDGTNQRARALQSMNSGASAPNANAILDYTWWANLGATPTAIMLRNAANTDFIKVMEFEPTPAPGQFRLFSLGNEVLTAGANTLTGNQTVDITGSAAIYIIGSDQNTGVVSQIILRGHDSGGNNLDAGQIDADIIDNTDGSEDTEVVIRTFAAGTQVERARFGATSTFLGILNAGTLQQGGTPVADLINDAIAKLIKTDFAGALALTQGMEGTSRRFTGGAAANVTVPVLEVDTVITIHNDGSAPLTFVPSSTTLQKGTTLAAGNTCMLVWLATNVVRILGENT